MISCFRTLWRVLPVQNAKRRTRSHRLRLERLGELCLLTGAYLQTNPIYDITDLHRHMLACSIMCLRTNWPIPWRFDA